MASLRRPFRPRSVSIRLLGGALLLAACGDDPSDSEQNRVATVRITPQNPTVTLGAEQQLTATALNSENTSVPDKTATWNSSNPLIVEVDASGEVRATGLGNAQITATIDNINGTTTVTVSPPPVADVTVTGSATSVDVGSTLQLTATPRDEQGAPLTGRQVTWSSSQASIATVTATGLVQGVTPGQVQIRATSEGIIGTFDVSVTSSGPELTITNVSPATITESATITVTGSGFGTTTAANVITVGGATTTVTSASDTLLTFTMPPGACLPNGSAVVRVVANGVSAAQVNHPFQPSRAALDLPIGEHTLISNPADFCLQFGPENADHLYVFGITSVSEVAFSLTPAQVTGIIPAGASASSSLVLSRTRTVTTRGSNPVNGSSLRMARHRSAEAQLRAQEREQMSRMSALRTSLYSTRSVPSVPPNAAVGDTVSIKVPNIRLNSCTNSTTIQAVVRTIGTRGVWVEDVGNPAGGFTMADFNNASTRFDTEIYPTNVAYFGEPSDRDGNSRIIVVTTKEVNRMDGILGFVTTADLAPEDCPAASNDGEYYYGAAPDPAGDYALGEFSVLNARSTMPGLIAHETAHVIQFGRRLAFPGATSFMSQWEAEGQATFAEEVNGHADAGNTPGQNYGFIVAWPAISSDSLRWYRDSFTDLALYYGFETQTSKIANTPEQCGWLASDANVYGPCLGQRNVYGVSWSFLRWLSDQYGPSYPGGEQAIHRALIDNEFVGFTTISDVIGEEIDVLLTRWAAALYLDDRFAGMDPELRFTSWNLFDIESALVPTARLTPRSRSFANFTDDVAVRAASTAYYRIGGANRPATSVRIRSPLGDPLPSTVRLWIVRAQ